MARKHLDIYFCGTLGLAHKYFAKFDTPLHKHLADTFLALVERNARPDNLYRVIATARPVRFSLSKSEMVYRVFITSVEDDNSGGYKTKQIISKVKFYGEE